MEIRYILEQVNERLLRRLVKENEWPSAHPDGGLLDIEDIARHITSHTAIERVWRSLTTEEKEVLLHFLFRVGTDMMTYRQMEEHAKIDSQLAIYSGLTGLRQRGLIYTLRRLWGELAYYLPNDVQTAYRSWLLPRFMREHPIPACEVACDWDTSSTPLARVVFRLLQMHRYQPIGLTKKGTITMKTRRVWQNVVPYPQEMFLPLMPDAAGEQEAREQFLLELLLTLGMLRKHSSDEGMQYVVDEERTTEVFRGDEAEVQRRLYLQVKEMVGRLHPCYSVIFDWMEAAGGQTFSLHALREAECTLLGSVVSFTENEHWQAFVKEVAPILSLFGFTIRKGEEEAAVFSWDVALFASEQEEGEAVWEGTGYVQPTFEILLLPHAPYDVRWQLGRYATLEEQQEVWRFQLTKTSVQACEMESEQERGRLLRILERIQPDVPANVREQTYQWMSGDVPLTFMRVTILRCPDVETADWLAGEPDLTGGLRERLNNYDFLIDESSKEKLQQVLAGRGLRISESNGAKLKMKEVPQLESAEASLVSVESGYKVESVFPLLTDVLPELKEVPAIWHKNFQRYHHSTLRKLMSTARDLGISVSAEIDGKLVEPIRIVDIKNEEGRYRLTLSSHGDKQNVDLEEIGRVKLKFPLLPGRD
ncbi:hypothetical protein AM501_21845 [Aneurinibacillus migulanus]|uniref:hypothetical protein n=1 Tax=Aneurinibacillus migulanus TaxID=47500 RepID=UPI0005B99895|nr:hypothetical protein [Aneurinibacillus migulanus]KIV58033.1 hypothetical protein TS64_05655 [Aneurinibacillus migulanus]KPD06251.1 hypothetical protein AM501_21845 [Aneurinibacillus migulanus]MCP1355889.1 hypothetical protein [Aneurinibacillus migulanus]MED4730399.1 hypothetical protein [Aneurinibacillus migulanus]CEH28504.1 Uncharacterized protein BN1090_A2_00925 [Aneurinibacillus migulanus]